jgi:hypothetical protein
MPTTNDLWYIRFPNGRVLRAAGATVVRQQLAAGRFPPGTRLRRTLDEEWRAIDRFPEFTDLVNGQGKYREATSSGDLAPGGSKRESKEIPATIASRLDPTQLRLVGVRGYLEELYAALDSTAVSCKVQTACVAGMLIGALIVLAQMPLFAFTIEPLGWGWLLAGGAILVLAWLAGVISRTTYAELSRLRPSGWRDAWPGLGTLTARLTVAFGLVGGFVGGMVGLLRWLPGCLLLVGETRGEAGWSVAATVAAVLAVPGEVLLWLLLLMLLPVGALLVVEEESVLAGLWHWLRLIRKKPGRLLVAEGLALGIALVLAMPLALLLAILWTWQPAPTFGLAVDMTRAVIGGLMLAFPVAYILVANVFIYLNLRYDSR